MKAKDPGGHQRCVGTSESEHTDGTKSGTGWHVESPGVSPMACLKSLGGSHMSLGIWLKLMPSESGTSSSRAEPITYTWH